MRINLEPQDSAATPGFDISATTKEVRRVATVVATISDGRASHRRHRPNTDKRCEIEFPTTSERPEPAQPGGNAAEKRKV